jgi:2,5-diamino-6-(ribosylamino)-4(3H)-pyrimidinone 5'-phosphate reductase
MLAPMSAATDRPFVYMNMAMTADGKITSAAREYPRFTSPRDRRTMDRLRAEADAVLVGAGTLRADDPPLHVRDPEMLAYRRSLGRPDGLLNIVVTASADLDPASRFFRTDSAAGRIVATVEDVAPERAARLEEVAEVWRLGRGLVDLRELLRRLHARGVKRLLVEGGGELNWGFVRDDLLDELYVTVAPVLLGGADAPTLLEGEGLSMAAQRKLALTGMERHGDEIYCRYTVLR